MFSLFEKDHFLGCVMSSEVLSVFVQVDDEKTKK